MTQEIKDYTNTDMFLKLFDDVIELVDKCSHYMEGDGRYEISMRPLQEQQKYASQGVNLTTALMTISQLVLSYRTYSKNETETLKNTVFTPFTVEVDHNLPFKFNWLLSQVKFLYDRVQRIDNQFKNDNKSYFKNLTIAL